MAISIIIPILNEEEALSELLPFLNGLDKRPDEVIVVDAGSTDKSQEVAQKYGAKVIVSQKEGRAIQQHVGALKAEEQTLCFLHADTFPNKDFIGQIEEVLANKKVSLGGFISIMKGERTRWWISYLNYVKTYFCPLVYSPKKYWKGLRLIFGDQVLFCRKSDYLQSGGFDLNDKVMEEAKFCLRMNELGRAKLIHRFVYSSDRRVAKWGFWKANRIYIGIAMGWAIGYSTQKLAEQYEHIR